MMKTRGSWALIIEPAGDAWASANPSSVSVATSIADSDQVVGFVPGAPAGLVDVRPIERWLIGAPLCRVGGHGQQQRVNGVLRLSHVRKADLRRTMA